MTTNIFNEMTTIASNYPHLLTSYRNDLFEIDRDTIMNEAVAGDKYLWVLKGSGCGTWLLRLGSEFSLEMAEYIVKNEWKEAEFFWIHVNKDDYLVQHITRNHAAALAANQKPNHNRVPKRRDLFTQVLHDLGLNGHTNKPVITPAKFRMAGGFKGRITITPTAINKDTLVFKVVKETGESFMVDFVLPIEIFCDFECMMNLSEKVGTSFSLKCDGKGYGYPETLH